jgi:glutathione peroxidase
MRKYFYIILLLAFTGIFIYSFVEVKNKKTSETMSVQTKDFYSLSIKVLDGSKTINFSRFKGKKVLLVNVASECGYTPQYKELQALHNQYKDKLVVIGFPCNQFGGQEPGTAKEIASFCEKNYGVTFLLTEKIDVKGEKQHEVYQWLTQKALNGVSDADVKWNFNKFLVDEKGRWLAYFPSSVNPLSNEIIGKL